MFPGFGLAVGAFAVYLAVDAITHPSNVEKLKEDARKQTGRTH
jgi:NADH dehydrogenase (ubiquinone) 1 beta subcomplex subunit 3